MRGSFWKAMAIPAALLGLLAAGCGEGAKEASDKGSSAPTRDLGTDPGGVARVGADVCINCHETFSWSSDIVAGYLEGKHVVHSTHVTAASGAGCLSCHDPVGDGNLLAGLLSVDLVPADGLAAVTCEACHGGGGEHFGAGPMPNPKPAPDTCAGGEVGPVGGACHTDLAANPVSAGHQPFHAEGMNVVAEFKASAHWREGVAGHASTKCTRCHTDEGAKKYINVTAVDILNSAVQTPDMTTSPVQCRTCHDTHDAGKLLKDATSSASAEYNTCTHCHQSATTDITADGVTRWTDTPAGSTTDGGLISKTGSTLLLYHGQRWERIIASNHYDNPATTDVIEGFNVNVAGDRSCRDCHNVHSADLTLQRQWAQSAHAGDIAAAKEAAAAATTNDTLAQTIAVQKAGVSGAVWTDDPWATDDEAGCQRCHTATGVMNLLTNPTDYYTKMAAFTADPSTGPNPNDFSYLKTGQAELLYCWGCHADNAGGLRNAGKTLPLQDRGGVIFATIPDIGKSGVCVACHGGRGNTATIVNSSRSSRFQGHHAPTGGSVFNELTHTGYEFTGLDYTSAAFRHDDIGRNGDTPESGAGPCASCHMSGADHTFEAAEFDADTGAVTAIKAQALCDTCHGAGGITPSDLVAKKAGQADAVKLLGDYVKQTNGITNYLGLSVSANYADVPLDAYGAFQNWKYMDGEDPCAYLHNSRYAKRLLFDSIDWLDGDTNGDGNNLDGTITINVSAHTAAAAWLGAGPDGTTSRP